MEENTKPDKAISFSTTRDYKRFNQWIFGVTLNHEEQIFSSSGLYDEVDLKRNKYEFNIWLFRLGLHLTILGKMKKY